MPNLFADEVAVGYAHIAVERAVDRYPDGLTYGIPSSLKDLTVGERVIVPLGKGNTGTVGYVVDRSEHPGSAGESHEIKLIKKRDESGARLPADLISLARWISTYYCAPIGMTLASTLPAAVKKNTGAVTRVMIDLGNPLLKAIARRFRHRSFVSVLAVANWPDGDERLRALDGRLSHPDGAHERRQFSVCRLCRPRSSTTRANYP